MATRLSPSLHYVAIGGEVVFLDMDNDRYFLASGALASDFLEWLRERSDEGMTDRLLKSRIVETCQGWQPRGAERLRLPAASLVDAELPKVSPLLILEAALFQLMAQYQLRRLPLHSIMARLNKRLQVLDDAEPLLYLQIVAAFQKARRLVQWDKQCLSRSIAMANMLVRRNASAQLVIGVMLPFSAHCWVQHGDRSLTDPMDTLNAFSPIYRAGSA